MKFKSITSFMAMGVLIAVASASCTSSDPATYKFRDKVENVTYANARNARNNLYGSGADMTSNGRTLIIPVQFADFMGDDLPSETREVDGGRKDIYNVNFGEAEDTQWQSLKSYYYKSSYGKTDLTGAVTPWFTPYSESNDTPGEPLTAKGLATEAPGYQGAARVLRQAYSWLDKLAYAQVQKNDGTYYSTSAELFKDFDIDGNGLIDNIQLVYSCHSLQKDGGGNPIDNTLFWAFRTSTGYKANKNKPVASNYLWLSYYTFYENGYYTGNVYHDYTDADIASGTAKLDAHTLIHETGHALGLEDYYTNTNGDISAAGKFLMMDYNIGDHDPFSKAAYGWTNPTVVLDSCEISLSKFQETGDSIIIPAKGRWTYGGTTNTLLDEYIMLEYYTPDGLNAFDTAHNYTGSTAYPKGPTTSGIKVWHIDARLGSFLYSDGSLQFVRYETSLVAVTNGFTYMANSNNAQDNKSAGLPSSNKLIETMKKNGLPMRSGETFNDDFLWGQGDTFGVSTWQSYAFHSGDKFGYTLEVLSLGDTASIKITANAA
ncbi:MAG: hypothetical protein WC366_03205 [Bacilli bacterium]|jgi:M6 family metalloprotease-like protein